MNLPKLFVFVYLCSTLSLLAQNDHFDAKVSSTAILSSQSEIPFWLRANTGFEFSEFTNFSGVVASTYTYNFKKFTLEAGAYIFARDGVENNIQRRDLYIQASNKWLNITVGSKQWEEAFFGLSSTNQNFLFSNNARPLPGIIIEANEPFTLFKKLKVDWAIAHYNLNDNRFVANTNVHYKRVSLQAPLSKKSNVTLGIQHFAQWGGTSTSLGVLPNNLNAFWDVFLAKQAPESNIPNEAFNALGNHLGSYTFKYDLQLNQGALSFYHEHPFEDGSGSRLQNFEDGVWGLTFKPSNNSIIKGILYEYVETRDQSGRASTSGQDNYFNNKIYRSGWTYEQNIIGSPFFKTDKSLGQTSGLVPVIGSRFQVHHLGIHAVIKQVSLTTRASYSKNIGTYSTPFNPSVNDFYFSTNAQYVYKQKHVFSILAGMDFSNTTQTIIATGANYAYIF